MSPEQIVEKIRQLQKKNEYLKRQREILKSYEQQQVDQKASQTATWQLLPQ